MKKRFSSAISGHTILLLDQSSGLCGTQISYHLRPALMTYSRPSSRVLWRSKYEAAWGYLLMSMVLRLPSLVSWGYKTRFTLSEGIACHRAASKWVIKGRIKHSSGRIPDDILSQSDLINTSSAVVLIPTLTFAISPNVHACFDSTDSSQVSDASVANDHEPPVASGRKVPLSILYNMLGVRTTPTIERSLRADNTDECNLESGSEHPFPLHS